MTEEKREVTVQIPYPGSVISVNHYLGRRKNGGHFVQKSARQWKDLLGWAIKSYHIEDWQLPIKVTVNGVFKDLRSCPDPHNLVKVIADSIEEVTGLNDRDFKTETGEPLIDPTVEPYLLIKIEVEDGKERRGRDD